MKTQRPLAPIRDSKSIEMETPTLPHLSAPGPMLESGNKSPETRTLRGKQRMGHGSENKQQLYVYNMRLHSIRQYKHHLISFYKF